MQDLMKQIIEMDRKARQIMEAAQKEKADSEKEIQQKREQIRQKYLEEARKRIAQNEPKERAAAQKAFEEAQKKSAILSENLEKLYREKGISGWMKLWHGSQESEAECFPNSHRTSFSPKRGPCTESG